MQSATEVLRFRGRLQHCSNHECKRLQGEIALCSSEKAQDRRLDEPTGSLEKDLFPSCQATEAMNHPLHGIACGMMNTVSPTGANHCPLLPG